MVGGGGVRPGKMAAKLFLGGISPNTQTEDLETHFGQYGTVVDAIVMYKDGRHRGFGFVTFDDMESIHLVLGEEQVIDGRVIDVKEAMPQGEAPPPRAASASTMAVPMGRNVSGPDSAPGVTGPPKDPIEPMSRASGSRVSRVLEGSMDAAAMQ